MAHQGVDLSAWVSSFDGIVLDVRGKPRTAPCVRGEACSIMCPASWLPALPNPLHQREHVAQFINCGAIVEFHADVRSDDMTAKLNKI
jgi:hypothetical protein